MRMTAQKSNRFSIIFKGNSLEFAKSIDDGKVFHMLEKVPAEKHPCIQLAVKTLHKALNSMEVDDNHNIADRGLK